MRALAEIKQDLSLAHTHTPIHVKLSRTGESESKSKYIKEAEFPHLLLLSLNLATCMGHKLTAK